MAAPLHASVRSGKVLEIKEVQEQGRSIMACIVQKDADPSKQELSYYNGAADISKISGQEILTGIRDGGLTGMGGAGFPHP